MNPKDFKPGDYVQVSDHCTGQIIAISCDGDIAMVSVDLGDDGDILWVNLDELELVKGG